MKTTISILLLFVCFGCSQKSRNIYWIISGSDTIIVDADKNIVDVSKAKSSTGSKINDSVFAIRFAVQTSVGIGEGGGGIGLFQTISADGHFDDSVITIVGDKNDGVTKGVASFNADDFNCDSGIVIDYDDYAKNAPMTGFFPEEWDAFRNQKSNVYWSSATEKFYDSLAKAPYPQYDTQKVIMLVCDTSKGQMYIYQKFAHVIYGYTVRETYLDADKKPLSKSIIVWQTKELK